METDIDYLDFKPEKLSAVEIAGDFAQMARTLLETKRAQKFGNYVLPLKNSPSEPYLAIHRQKYGRVTSADLYRPGVVGNRTALSDRIQFTPKDSRQPNLEVAEAVFITFEYNKSGQKIASKTQARSVNAVDLSDNELLDTLLTMKNAYIDAMTPPGAEPSQIGIY